MNRLQLLFCALFFGSLTNFAQTQDEIDLPDYKMFSVEATHAFNGSINKQGINSRIYFWVNDDYSIGQNFIFIFLLLLVLVSIFKLILILEKYWSTFIQ
jgi:hypothetical protein